MAQAVIGALRVNLGIDTAAFSRGLKDSEKRLETFGAKVTKQVGVIANGLKVGLAGIGLLGLERVARAIGDVVTEAADLVDVADKIGVTTRALQELRFAGTQSGVAIGEMDNALSFFSRQLGEASRGAGDLYEILKLNNIALRDQAGNVRPLSELFRDYIGMMERAASTQERAVLVTKAFGRAADEMGNLTAAGVGEAVGELNRLGGVMDEGMLRRIAEIDDRWDKFATTIGVKVKSAVLDTVDAFSQLFDRMNDIEEQQSINIQRQLIQLLNARVALLDRIASYEKSNWFGSLERAKAQLELMDQEIMKLREILDLRAGYVPPGAEAPGAPAPPAVVPPDPGVASRAKAEAERAQREQEQAEERLERLRQSLMTEEEEERNSHLRRLVEIAEFEDQKLLTARQANDLRAAAEREHWKEMEDIALRGLEKQAAMYSDVADRIAAGIEGISQAMGIEGEKQFKLMKAVSMAVAVVKGIESVISSYAAGARIGGPVVGAAFAALAAAATAGQIAALARTKMDGGGGSGAVSAAGAAAASGAGATAETGGAPSQTLYVEGINRNQLYSGDAVRDLAERLIEYQRDGGKIVLA